MVVERIVQELRGLPCAELTVEPAAKLQILSSRSFGERVTDRGEMAQALSGFMARAAEKLRAEGMCCQRVHLFVRTSPFDERAPYYSEQAGVRLVCPSDDTRLLLQQVNVLLPQIWRDGYRYQKGGVMLSEFTPKGQQQADLFAGDHRRDRAWQQGTGGRRGWPEGVGSQLDRAPDGAASQRAEQGAQACRR